ncbi:MAG: winged helix-turn-helix transcriptional regulator [Caldilineaceae bacterium]|nr:winged helix-turn-helix transcriptional regulator [Caldilineaceae bacterium]
MTLGGILVPVPPLVEVTVALEPVDSTLMSLAALREPAEYGGMDEWAVNTAAQLPTTLRERHNFWMKWLWMDTLANAVERTAAINSFPAYLDALAAEDATVLRDRLLHWLIHSVHVRLYAGTATTPATLRADPAQLLRDGDHFAQWLLDRFTEKPLAAELADLPAFHALLNTPEALQAQLVPHLRQMWDEFLAPEWRRIAPRLQRCVDAFQALELRNIPMLDAMQVVTGRDLRPLFHLDVLWRYHRVRFIPAIHNGPYVVWYGDEEEVRIGFPAHEPPTHLGAGLRFDERTLVNRFKALADETRLAMLWALREAGELSTQELIDRFDLDKSAASRHLRQLVANDLLEERREEGAKKVYRLNDPAIDAVTRMLHGLR